MLSFRLKFLTPYAALKNVTNSTLSSPVDVIKAIRCCSTQTEAAVKRWKIVTAVCLERLPIIAPPMKPIEKQMAELFHEMDVLKSLKADHELRQEEDRKRAVRLSEGAQLEETDPDAAIRQTAQDFEDMCNEEFSKYKSAPRETEADVAKDKTSIDRMLDRHLLFVVKKSGEAKTSWVLPEKDWQEGETLRETAERVLEDCVKLPKTPIHILGNAPWGVHTVKYSKAARQSAGYDGAKIFFFKAQLKEKNWTTNSNDYLWLGREELKDHLPSDYLHSVQKFLIDED